MFAGLDMFACVHGACAQPHAITRIVPERVHRAALNQWMRDRLNGAMGTC